MYYIFIYITAVALNLFYVGSIWQYLFYIKRKISNLILKNIIENVHINKINFLFYLYIAIFKLLKKSVYTYSKYDSNFSYRNKSFSLKKFFMKGNFNSIVFFNKNIFIFISIFLLMLRPIKEFKIFFTLSIIFLILRVLLYIFKSIFKYIYKYKYRKYMYLTYNNKCEEIIKWSIEVQESVDLIIYYTIEYIDKTIKDFKYINFRNSKYNENNDFDKLINLINNLDETNYKKFTKCDYLQSLHLVDKTNCIFLRKYIKTLILFCEEIQKIDKSEIIDSSNFNNFFEDKIINLIDYIIVIEKSYRVIYSTPLADDTLEKCITPILKNFFK